MKSARNCNRCSFLFMAGFPILGINIIRRPATWPDAALTIGACVESRNNPPSATREANPFQKSPNLRIYFLRTTGHGAQRPDVTNAVTIFTTALVVEPPPEGELKATVTVLVGPIVTGGVFVRLATIAPSGECNEMRHAPLGSSVMLPATGRANWRA